MANDINNLQALYNKQYETLQGRLSNIDKQRSGMRDFYTRAEPMVNEQLLSGRVKGTFATPGYQTAFTNSLANTQKLTDMNSEYATTEDSQFQILDSLAKYLQEQEDKKSKTDKEKKEDAKYETETGTKWNPETEAYENVGGINKNVDNNAKLVIQGMAKIADIPIKERAGVLQRMNELGFDPAKLEKSVIEQAEKLFMGDNPNALPVLGTEVAQGSKLAEFLGLGRKIGKFANFGKGAKENEYNEYVKSITATLRELTGEKGMLSDKDKEDLRELLPKPNMSLKQAKEKFIQAKNLIDAKYNKGPSTNSPSEGEDVDPLGIL